MILYAWTDKLFKIKYVVVSVPVNTDIAKKKKQKLIWVTSTAISWKIM